MKETTNITSFLDGILPLNIATVNAVRSFFFKG